MTARRSLFLLILCGVLSPLLGAEEPHREVAITIDDLPIAGPAYSLESVASVNTRLLETLAAHRAPAIGFVNEGKLQIANEEEERTAVLDHWLAAGFALGNHTYSHRSLHRIPLEEYEEDILRGEPTTRRLMQARGMELRYFRHPFTHTGRSLKDKRGLESFLRAHGYVVAPFTIENADYIFNAVYVRARLAGDDALSARVRQAYLDYTDSVLAFIERYATELFGRDIRQILLIHDNPLNADCLDEMLTRLEKRGYVFVTLDNALRDEAYNSPDNYTGPVGPSWLHRWATSRRLPSRLADEPDPPEFILRLYQTQQ